ncbi:MAG: DUF885 domain-containing protein [Candidatus Eisenbacteria bacterium]|uniref:DUF885 domain-containing protein n=1 Tax=Eiseniibacteriota bacterium TaxID=2212470 RepID=A0A849SJE2_UNCEI|nr:DUF885 domain-containing protein [Candidatus Eisenbacteria bacterium]
MARNVRRWFGRVLLVLLAVAAIWLVPTIWFRPWQIDAFYARVFLRFAVKEPMMLTMLGIFNGTPISYYQDDLGDFSPAKTQADAKMVDENLAMLRSYSRKGMTLKERLSAEVLDYFLEDQQRGKPFMFYDYPLNQLRGFQSQLPEFMTTLQPLKTAEDARNYVKRTRKFGVAVDQLLAGVELREKQGVMPPRWVLEKVLTQVNEFKALEPKANPLYLHFADSTKNELKGLKAEERTKLLGELESAIREVVDPAWGRMSAVVERQIKTATDDDGVWKLPKGDAYYDYCLRTFTTSDLPADSIHQIGMGEVARIQTQMRDILHRQGYDARELGATVKRMRDEPRFHFGGTVAAARESILAGYQAILDDANRRVADLFDVRPKAKLEVHRVPEFNEKGSPGAYYNPAAFDGSRGGVFFANLRDPNETSRPDMRTLAYHEGIPGHHFQLSIQQELKGVPFFRKVLPFTAYAEGWGLYAERLALENGFQPTPYDSIGALQAELFRAVRLVVDTGIHRKHWTRGSAIKWMVSNTGMDSSEVATEIERYIVNPGQACAYKVGQLEILALRAHAREVLGDRFDIRKFHNVVLTNGSLPLTLLAKVVHEWIDEEQKGVAQKANG